MKPHQFATKRTSTQRVSFLGATVTSMMLLASCAQMPTGPSVAVMPGPNKPFEIFMQDDQLCRSWASHAIGLAGHDAAAEQLLATTITGAAIGAIAGAAGGGHRSVETGAAMGTVVGATVGANQSAATAWNAQRRYDIAYQQCMYSKGNLVSYYGDRPIQNPAPMWAPPPPPSPR
jgi:hypothetical protein